MLWLKLFFLLLLVLLGLALAQGIWSAVRFRRRFDDSTGGSAERLRQHVEGPIPRNRARAELQAVPEGLSRDDIHEVERELLRHLCTQEAGEPDREEALRFLNAYSFQDIIHEQVFHALRDLQAADPDLIREQLPARLTQRGFPDIDFESFLTPCNSTSRSVEELVEQLRRGTKGP